MVGNTPPSPGDPQAAAAPPPPKPVETATVSSGSDASSQTDTSTSSESDGQAQVAVNKSTEAQTFSGKKVNFVQRPHRSLKTAIGNFFGVHHEEHPNLLATEEPQNKQPTVTYTANGPDLRSIKPEIPLATAPAPVQTGEWRATLDTYRSAGTDLAHVDERFGQGAAGLAGELTKRGFNVEFISLYRSHERQKELIDEYTVRDAQGHKVGMSHMVASEYGSAHGVGCAADFSCRENGNSPQFLKALAELAPKYGLTTIKGDPGHVQLDDRDYIHQRQQEEFGFKHATYEKPKATAFAPMATI